MKNIVQKMIIINMLWKVQQQENGVLNLNNDWKKNWLK